MIKHRTPVLTAELMRRCDTHTINTLAVPSQVLMERAARGVVTYLEDKSSLYFSAGNRVLVLCGSGNNGGDGFAVARFLHEGEHGHPRVVSVCYCGRLNPDGSPDKTHMSVECARQYDYVRKMLIPIFSPAQVGHSLDHANVVVDALFGIGLDRPISGTLADLIHTVNERHVPVLAVDMPSGIHSDTGAVMGVAIQATATVTMQALKTGQLLYPGADFCGDIHVCDIGVDLTPAADQGVYLADERCLADIMTSRSRRTHKGTYGRIALVCGSYGMSGAAVLATRAALRSGVGLAHTITPECNRQIMQTSVPEAVLSCYDAEAPDLKMLTSLLATCDGAVIGCGLGISAASARLLRRLLETLPLRPDYPVVLDADALNLLAAHPSLWHTRLLTKGQSQVIMTPHPMEMARLTGQTVAEILTDLPRVAASLAKTRGVTVVLKDAHTVITAPDGTQYICPFGNAGMAKGGCGDVLAGIIGALAVQRRSDLGRDLIPADVAAAGVALHALAGDAAADTHGEYALTPSDIVEHLGTVTRVFSDTRTKLTLG